jgi:hypothetical protein
MYTILRHIHKSGYQNVFILSGIRKSGGSLYAILRGIRKCGGRMSVFLRGIRKSGDSMYTCVTWYPQVWGQNVCLFCSSHKSGQQNVCSST